MTNKRGSSASMSTRDNLSRRCSQVGTPIITRRENKRKKSLQAAAVAGAGTLKATTDSF